MLFLVYLQAIWDCYAVDFDVDFVDGVSLTRADISFEGLGARIEVRLFVVDGCAFSSCRISLKRCDALEGPVVQLRVVAALNDVQLQMELAVRLECGCDAVAIIVEFGNNTDTGEDLRLQLDAIVNQFDGDNQIVVSRYLAPFCHGDAVRHCSLVGVDAENEVLRIAGDALVHVERGLERAAVLHLSA